jgi:D-alanyl-lipoteichoic acid acyltransferase DltB (MBOAT superfamily)
MIFNSFEFALFLPGVFGAYWVMRSTRAKQLVLLVASYLFYAAWDWRFLSLILISTIVDYTSARKIAVSVSGQRRRRWVTLSIVVNLGMLATFKYLGFFVDSASALLDRVGFEANPAVLSVALPVGISFYTFQTLSYTIDVYRSRIQPERNLTTFALFVAFFPQLVAGPIERAERLLPQLEVLERPSTSDLRAGVRLIGLGLFRKVAIADGVAPIVEQIFSDPAAHRSWVLFVGAMAFSIQIYGDFAGYTDIARGTARLFGVSLVENFRQPYMAKSFSEFWRRWHITLSEWLRDYLYIPLGGNRGGRLATSRNLMATMLLGGLWHGAAWTFVLWGGLHGMFLVTERFLPASLSQSERSSSLWSAGIAVFVTLAWIPFRADSWPNLTGYVSALATNSGSSGLAPSDLAILLFAVLGTVAIDVARAQGVVNPVTEWAPIARGFAYGFAIIVATIVSSSSVQTFIYFQF